MEDVWIGECFIITVDGKPMGNAVTTKEYGNNLKEQYEICYPDSKVSVRRMDIFEQQ